MPKISKQERTTAKHFVVISSVLNAICMAILWLFGEVRTRWALVAVVGYALFMTWVAHTVMNEEEEGD